MSGSAAAVPAAKPQTLDELMLAMDVVDTIRHRELLVERELGQGERDEALRQRLRDIYTSQGLTVTDRIIDQGIKALRESRFVYTPPGPSLGRTLAMIWIRRGRILGVIAAILIGGTALWAGYQYGIVAPAERAAEVAKVELAETLPKSLQLAYDNALRESKVTAARTRADQLFSDGRAALANKDAAAARTAVAGLDKLRGELIQTYQLRIVTGERDSGFWRIPDANQEARNFYLVVEAIGANGEVLTMPVINEEDGKIRNVTTWGVRVPEDVFEEVREDKNDDGIIQNRVLAEKRRGELDPRYTMSVLGGTVTSWDN
ncbi:MAG: DUF6384 family protein [Alphaproteobacteria bacterium]|jgi:hypothetical protein|nr:DUF6384 family protein [Alphaproteobacteria bacterium]